jgi:hypothetical protein
MLDIPVATVTKGRQAESLGSGMDWWSLRTGWKWKVIKETGQGNWGMKVLRTVGVRSP